MKFEKYLIEETPEKKCKKDADEEEKDEEEDISDVDDAIKRREAKYIATLNNNAKAWSTNVFLEAFADNGIVEYKKFKAIMGDTGLTITDLLTIYCGSGSGVANTKFKDGELVFVNEADSDKLLKAVKKVKGHIPNKAYVRRSLYKVMRIAKDYDKLAKAIVRTAKALETACAKFSENEAEFYDHLVDIYKAEFKIKGRKLAKC